MSGGTTTIRPLTEDDVEPYQAEDYHRSGLPFWAWAQDRLADGWWVLDPDYKRVRGAWLAAFTGNVPPESTDDEPESSDTFVADEDEPDTQDDAPRGTNLAGPDPDPETDATPPG